MTSWFRDGVWLFLGMAAYGPRWWALAGIVCWIAYWVLSRRKP